ncbi:MAG: SGNH/GDSL hydrolase family protein [Paenibacillus dendritiformis]|uniref:SGNH/GDSL hydrolase family protein n=1 Tax=Paenibacillus dendritiformis TaxID=130049 RepID=UPI00143D5E04|nr:SGNH/GDSL hydrolase family protein [Paenibacillus dendritiformis]MDU5140829.1 SGNH/GDSL hydrolase family protein [Paenibacillus dendritiformis]NKI21894.1 SGNH/GDSL hydrolase family protein [Paenibacillus dendritiformis]NRF97386.1 SGNH/GDSL hydrolase family protein [Paenibacillus dendritiformis]
MNSSVPKRTIQDRDVVLFQGDSITDAGRQREFSSHLGTGYAFMAAGLFQSMYPQIDVSFLNRGISGDRVRDLQARWEEDCLKLKPTWVSIYIGINDCWRRYSRQEETTAEQFESGYRDIIERTLKELDAQLVLVEPFVLPVPADRMQWREDLDPKIHIVRGLAREYGAYYVPLDGLFAQAAARREAQFWAPDGVHPTPAGHALIAKAWLEAVGAPAK